VRAADSVLNHAARAIEIEDLEARLTAVSIVGTNGQPQRLEVLRYFRK
jgi:hypothetical protein